MEQSTIKETLPTTLTPTKFTVDEQGEIKSIRDGFDRATVTFGNLYLQKLDLEKHEKQLQKEFELLQSQEKAFLDKIVAKYGEGTYDQSTGVFTSRKKS
jgi:predicted transcriptional regulator